MRGSPRTRPLRSRGSAPAQCGNPGAPRRARGRAAVVGPFLIAAVLIGLALWLLFRGSTPDPADPGVARPATEIRGKPGADRAGGTAAGGETAGAPAAAPDAEEAAPAPAAAPGGAIEGSVTEAASGNPAPGVIIVARPEVPGREEDLAARLKTPAIQETDRSAESDRGGRYRIGGLSPGDYRVFAFRGQTDFVGVPPQQGTKVTIGADLGTETVDFKLMLGGVVRGRVFDPEEKPLAGAEVVALPTDLMATWFDSLAGGQGSGQAKSAEDGSYRIGGLPLGKSYRVMASLEGWAPSAPEEAEPTAEEREIELNLTLVRGSTVSGRVVETGGKPVAGARVRLIPEESTDFFYRNAFNEASSGESGEFEFKHLPPGGYTLSAEAPKRKAVSHDLDCDGETDLTSMLLVLDAVLDAVSSPGGFGAVSGRVEDDAGTAIEGVALQLIGFSPGKGPFNATVTSAGDGRFSFENVPTAPYNLMVTSPKHAFFLKQGVTPGLEPVLVVLNRFARVSGTVVARATGEPIVGASVRLTTGDDPAGSMARLMSGQLSSADPLISSGTGGAFVIENAVPGRGRVRATAGGYAPGLSEDFDLAPGREVSGVEVALSGGGTIAGIVLAPDGARAGGASVTVKEAIENPLAWMMPAGLGGAVPFTATTDDDGAFRLEHLPQGKLALAATHPAYGPAQELPITLGRDETRERVQIRLRRPATIQIRVREKDRPREGMTVQLVGRGPMRMATAGPDGTAGFEGLAPGEYVLQLMDLLGMMAGKGAGFRQKVVRVAEGEEAQVDFLLGTGARIHGRVNGDLPANMPMVVLRRRDAPLSEDIDYSDLQAGMVRSAEGNVSIALIGQDGSYSLSEVPEGDFYLEVPKIPTDWNELPKWTPAQRKPLYREKVKVESQKDLEWNITLGGPSPTGKTPTTKEE